MNLRESYVVTESGAEHLNLIGPDGRSISFKIQHKGKAWRGSIMDYADGHIHRRLSMGSANAGVLMAECLRNGNPDFVALMLKAILDSGGKVKRVLPDGGRMRKVEMELASNVDEHEVHMISVPRVG